MAAGALDFSTYIADRTKDFTGREWVFAEINQWLADPNGARFFLLAGEPGSGKTAISARLVQFAQKRAALPTGRRQLVSRFISAFHFCSARDRLWINPNTFVESLAIQLVQNCPPFARFLSEAASRHQINIQVIQKIGSADIVKGVEIQQLNIGSTSPEDAYINLVREPLEALFQDGYRERMVILVDALDEALTYSGEINIIQLLAQCENLPGNMRFIVSSRPDERAEGKFLHMHKLTLSSSENEEHNLHDVRNYVNQRLKNEATLEEHIAQIDVHTLTESVERLVESCDGNFLYARFFIDDIRLFWSNRT